jgi:hypothetical protein
MATVEQQERREKKYERIVKNALHGALSAMAKQRTPEERERLDKMLRDNPELIRSLADPDDFRAVIIGQTYIEALLTLILEHHFNDDTLIHHQKFDGI